MEKIPKKHSEFIDNLIEILSENLLDNKAKEILKMSLNGSFYNNIGRRFNISSVTCNQIAIRSERKILLGVKKSLNEYKSLDVRSVYAENKRLKQEINNIKFIQQQKALNLKSEKEKTLIRQMFDKKIEDIDFSIRTYNSLKYFGINNILDLCLIDPKELLKVRGFGKRSLAEVQKYLYENDLIYFRYKNINCEDECLQNLLSESELNPTTKQNLIYLCKNS